MEKKNSVSEKWSSTGMAISKWWCPTWVSLYNVEDVYVNVCNVDHLTAALYRKSPRPNQVATRQFFCLVVIQYYRKIETFDLISFEIQVTICSRDWGGLPRLAKVMPCNITEDLRLLIKCKSSDDNPQLQLSLLILYTVNVNTGVLTQNLPHIIMTGPVSCHQLHLFLPTRWAWKELW